MRFGGAARAVGHPTTSAEEALDSEVRAGLSARRQTTTSCRTPSRSLELRPGVNIGKALQLSADIEDAEIVRKLELGK